MEAISTKGHRRIGKGAFSSVYRKGTSNTVLIISDDPVKECMSLGWFPGGRLFPKVDCVGVVRDRKAYSMKFYPKMKAPKQQLSKQGLSLYRALCALPYCYDSHELIEAFKALPCEFNKAKKQLIEAVEALWNYGEDVAFEISPRNVTCSTSGALVLLDCFFMRSHLMATRA